MKTDYTVEELLAQMESLKKTIAVQHETINQLIDSYVLKVRKPKTPKNSKK